MITDPDGNEPREWGAIADDQAHEEEAPREHIGLPMDGLPGYCTNCNCWCGGG